MIKSISYWAFPGGMTGEADVVDTMRQAKKLGFEAIELAIAADGELTHKTPEDACRAYRTEARRIGIQIASVCTGQFWAWSLTDRKASVRKKAYDFTTRALERTGWLGAGALLVVPGCVHADFIPGCPTVPYDFVWKTALSQVRKLAKVGQRHRVVVALENVWNKFMYSPLEFARFVDEIGSRWVGVYYDVANPVAFGVSADWARILGRRIQRVHFKEYKRGRNKDGSIYVTGFPEGFMVPLGEGDVDFPAVIKALKQIGYKGPVTYEWLNLDGNKRAPARCAREMYRVLGC